MKNDATAFTLSVMSILHVDCVKWLNVMLGNKPYFHQHINYVASHAMNLQELAIILHWANGRVFNKFKNVRKAFKFMLRSIFSV
jgi:hypothetical protein